MKKLSILITAYNEAKSIHLIFNKVKDVVLLNNIEKEIILVNDCSTDKTIEAYIKNNSELNISLYN